MDLSAHRHLVDCEWLQDNLEQPDLRIVECTSLLPNYFEESASEELIKESGFPEWEAGHIPGSAFVDILGELSNATQKDFMYGICSADEFAAAMSRIGIGDGVGVVLYDRAMNMWAARVWWLLRHFGFDNAVVLDGGWTAWVAAGYAVSTAAPNYPPATFVPNVRPQLIADKQRVLAATENNKSCLINALDPDEFAGRPPQRYARSGRIPSSANVPFAVTADPESQIFATDETLTSLYRDAGAEQADEVICYCGGGIAACSTALTLTRLGYDNVAVYDGSMSEWTSDPDLPVASG